MSELTVVQPHRPATIALMDPGTFDHMQRVGKMLAMSPLFPEHLRKTGNEIAIANAVLVLNIAMRLGEDPLTVGQNIYFVGGKPGWSASYMIAKANQHGVFRDPIDWEITGDGDALAVEAFAVLATTGRRVSVRCDMAMAKAEGWTKNPKYSSMPVQMLRYRSATFLIRLYCPEVMVGVPAAIEHEMGMRDVTPYEPVELPPTIHKERPEAEAPPATVQTAAKTAPEPVKVEARQEPVQTRQAAPAPAQKQPEADPVDMEALTEAMFKVPAFANALNDMADFDVDEVLAGHHKAIAAAKAKHPDLIPAFDAEVLAYRKAQRGED